MITDQNKKNLERLREELSSLHHFKNSIFWYELLSNTLLSIGFREKLSSGCDHLLNEIHHYFNCKVVCDFNKFVEKTEKDPLSGSGKKDVSVYYYNFKMEPL